MRSIFTLNPKVSTALFTLIGFILIEDLTNQEQNVLGNWLMLTAQVLITNATSQQLIENLAAGNNLNINSQVIKNNYSPLFYDIEMLKEIIRNNYPENINNIFSDIHIRLNRLEKIINEICKDN